MAAKTLGARMNADLCIAIPPPEIRNFARFGKAHAGWNRGIGIGTGINGSTGLNGSSNLDTGSGATTQ